MKKQRYAILADFHVHTVSSGHAYSTILEYAQYAKKAGLKYFAMTDHGPNMPGAPHIYHFQNLKMIPEKLFGIRVLRGAELNIIDQMGSLDLPDEDVKALEFVLFTFHPKCGYERDLGVPKNTEVMLKAMENSYVTAIAHLENPKFPVDYNAIISNAAKKNILIEVNNSSNISRAGSRDSMLLILKAVKKYGAMVCLGTDSHMCTMVGKFDYALELLNEAGISPDKVINTSEKLIKRFVLERGKNSLFKPATEVAVIKRERGREEPRL